MTNISSLLGVDINQYAGTFGERLQAAIDDSLDNGVLDVRHAMPDSTVGGVNQFIVDYTRTQTIMINKPLTIILPTGDINFINYSTSSMVSYQRHMFTVRSNNVTIAGVGRIHNGGTFKSTRLNMQQMYGGYHIYAKGHSTLTIRDLNMFGYQTAAFDAQETSVSKPINGAGGIYFETKNYGDDERISSVIIKSVTIFNSKYHSIYLQNSSNATIDDVYIERGGGHAIFINGGEGLQIRNSNINIAHKAGIAMFNHEHANILNTQTMITGIGYFIHDCKNISLTSTTAKSTGNRSNTVPNGEVTTTDSVGSRILIYDVTLDHSMLFKGSSYVIIDSQCINVMNVSSIDAGRPTIGGPTVDTRDILVRGKSRDIVITIPRTGLTAGSSFTGRFNIAFEQFAGETPTNCELVYNPMNSGTVTPGVPTQWISNINDDANKAPVFMEADSNVLVRSGRLFFTELLGAGFSPLKWTEQNW